jgi:hypothetical protein
MIREGVEAVLKTNERRDGEISSIAPLLTRYCGRDD